jgi:hypothetical protein
LFIHRQTANKAASAVLFCKTFKLKVWDEVKDMDKDSMFEERAI